MIPDWDPTTGNLPEGIHEAEWDEVEERLGFTAHRRQLLRGLREALYVLRHYDCQRAWIDGSFVSDKPEPGDFDVCWDHRGTRIATLQTEYPVFFNFSNRRRAQKERFGGEFFLAHYPADLLGTRFLDFFQTDRYTGDRKGIILVDLKALP
jgi:hypothetical protein